MFHSLVEKENRKISDGEQRSNLKIDSNKIHGKRTRWFLVDFSISHARRLVIVRVNCVENCILLSIGWISRSRNSHCPILFSARNFRQLPRTFPPSFTFGFRWWSFCRGIFKWVQRKGKLILLDIHRTSRRPISTRTVARRKGRTRRRCRSCCEISHGSTTPLPPCDSLSRSCLWPPSCTVDRRYEQNRSWKKRVAPLLAIDIKTSILMIRVHENISSYLSFLLSFSFDVSVFVDHCNFFFLSTESSLTCCTESCPASRRDCKEHESLGSPRTPRRSISGDGPSKSVSPSNWSSVSDSSRPANEKSPRFIEKNPLASAEKNISGWWKNDSRRDDTRDKSAKVITEVCCSLPAICLRYSRLNLWQETLFVFSIDDALSSKVRKEIHTHIHPRARIHIRTRHVMNTNRYFPD